MAKNTIGGIEIIPEEQFTSELYEQKHVLVDCGSKGITLFFTETSRNATRLKILVKVIRGGLNPKRITEDLLYVDFYPRETTKAEVTKNITLLNP